MMKGSTFVFSRKANKTNFKLNIGFMIRRVSKQPAPIVRQWFRYVAMHVKQSRIRVARDVQIKFAAYMALLGPPDNFQASQAFWWIQPLFFHKDRGPRWSSALEVIPPTAEVMQRVVECCRVVAPCFKNIKNDRFQLDKVVAVMVQIPDPAFYVDRCVKAGIVNVGAIFHQNTFDHARKRVRGALGTLARDAEQHGAQLHEIQVVSD